MSWTSIAVLGAGAMGAGIAQVAARAGCRVTLRDISDEALARGRASIDASLAKAITLGKSTPDERDATLARLQFTTSLETAVADVDLVLEAIPEVLALKQQLFREAQAHCRAEADFATNTSSLSIAAIAGATDRPDRMIGLHFFNPVPVMKLLEIVRGESTRDSLVDSARAFAAQLGKTAILVRDTPGFATSRLGVLLGLEAMRMVESGVASAEDIDTAMTLGYGHPMGPLRLTDLVGLDVRLGIADYLHATLGSEAFRAPELLRRMVAEGRLGKKTGRGFYEWGS